MTDEPGQLAYRTRYGEDDQTVSEWTHLGEAVKDIWAKVELAVEKRHGERLIEGVKDAQEAMRRELEARAGQPLPGESHGFYRGRRAESLQLQTVQVTPRFANADRAARMLAAEVNFQMSEKPGPVPKLSGNACNDCGGFRMVRTGKCDTCQDCGGSGGCG